jgi:hypothetical protein
VDNVGGRHYSSCPKVREAQPIAWSRSREGPIPDWDQDKAGSSKRKPQVKPQRCSDFVSPCATQAVLFVGAERADEFADATRLVCQGHDVIVINPRETAAARAFRSAGGTFVRTRVEQLPAACCRFDVICENYPYPSGRYYVPPRIFALARLARLAPGGRWVLFTEAARYATLLKAVGDYDEVVQRRFRVGLSSLSPGEAPLSAYPYAGTRFRLVFERRL